MIVLNEIDPYLCPAGASVRQALARLNTTEHLFQVVVDEDQRVVGTVTDGDIRRALLANAGLDGPISACFRADPILGALDDRSGNVVKLQGLSGHSAFIPVVDKAGVVSEILVGRRDRAGISTALVMAGGPGKRLGGRTRKTPKPLLPVGDRPILDHVLSALEEIGVANIFVSVHHMADQIRDYVGARDNHAIVRTLNEKAPLGTVGALASLPKPLTDAVMVVNGDVITRVNFDAMMVFHERHGHDATLCVAKHEVEVPFGVIKQTQDGVFQGIDEKPTIEHFIAAGIYYLSPAVCALVPGDRPMDMPELLNLSRGVGLKIGLFPIYEYWKDVGRPDDLESARRDHKKVS